jgi:hypothetical protein
MSNPPHTPKKPVKLASQLASPLIEMVESEEFERDADLYLKPQERRALLLALAEDPLLGSISKYGAALRELPFSNYVVIYAVSPDLLTVYLLILDEPSGPGGPPDGGRAPDDGDSSKKVRASLGYLVNGGVFAAGKKLFEWLLDLIN